MRWLSLLLLSASVGVAGAAEFLRLEGHGGPVKGIAVSPDGSQAATASFDYAVGVWDLGSGAEMARLTGHRAAANTVLFLPDGRIASGGDDFNIHLWKDAQSVTLTGHKGKVMGLALSPDHRTLASAAWDGWVGIWDISDGRLIRLIEGHKSNVTAVAFAEGGAVVYSASTDGTIRRWDVDTGAELNRVADHGFGVNTLLVDEVNGWLAYGGLDGGTRVLSLETGDVLADLTLERRPILAMARRPDGGQIAVGDGEGFIMVVNTEDWSITRDFRAAKRGPVWALAYTADGTGILAGGLDDAAYLWPLEGRVEIKMSEGPRTFLNDPRKMDNGARQFFRKCSICHTLTPDDARRAGPTLYGVFGRQAGTLPGYPYSDAMRGSNIIWSDTTISELFEFGPDHYTPGSKMPMQRITRAEDRADLVTFLERETRAGDQQ